MVTVHRDAIQLWDFDQDYDKKKSSCKLVQQLVFSQQSKIVSAKYKDGHFILEHADKIHFSVITVEVASESAKSL